MFCNDDETQSTKNYYIEKKKRELSVEKDTGFISGKKEECICDSFKKIKLSEKNNDLPNDRSNDFITIKKLEINCNGGTWFSTFGNEQK